MSRPDILPGGNLFQHAPYNSVAGGLPSPDVGKECQQYRGKIILVTGGANPEGTGWKLVKEVHRLGATVVIGTRKQESFAKAQEALGAERVYPFLGDITNTGVVNEGIEYLFEQGVIPNVVVHAAAGGIDKIQRDLLVGLARLRRMDPSDSEGKAEKAREIQDQLRAKIETPEIRKEAEDVNYWGPQKITGALLSFLGPERLVIDWSSILSSFYGQIQNPVFYEIVAGTKKKFEKFLENAGKSMVENYGIYSAIVSGHVIIDTPVGRLIDNHIVPLMSQEEQKAIRTWYITKKDMVTATRMVIESDLTQWREYPKKLYVVGSGEPGLQKTQFLPNLFADHPIFRFSLPL